MTKEEIKTILDLLHDLKHNILSSCSVRDEKEVRQTLLKTTHDVADLEKKFRNAIKETEAFKEYENERQNELNEWCESHILHSADLAESSETVISNTYGDKWEKDLTTGNWKRVSRGF